MEWRTNNSTALSDSHGRFLIGPPRDSDDFLQLFSLMLEKADVELQAGKGFGIPFAAFLKLAHRNGPSFDALARYCRNGNPGSSNSDQNWPVLFRNLFTPPSGPSQNSTAAGASHPVGPSAPPSTAMFLDLLRFALNSASSFHLEGPQVCRALAAVGQTLGAKDRRFRQHNRSLADRHRAAAQRRIGSSTAIAAHEPVGIAVRKEENPIVVKQGPPWQIEFRRSEEEAACLRLDGVVLWHASYIGARSAEKSENQDATFALTTPAMSSPPYLVFALADGVSTSLGSRLAATSIVRRFCELMLHHMNKGETVSGGDLIQAARKTQSSLEELTKTLLHDVRSLGFEALLGSDLTRNVAARVLENTLEPKVASMPAALNATLIGGVVQPSGNDGVFQVALLRIGDGSVEHIDARGNLTSVLATDPLETKVAEAMGPGPQSRALFEQPGSPLITSTVMLRPGEFLIVSSDGLARGHSQLISAKLAELLGEQFWKKARPEQADAALEVLHRACASADELFLEDAKQNLFADNVSLILIRSGD